MTSGPAKVRQLKVKRAPRQDAAGTWLFGYLAVTYDELVEALGPAGRPMDRDRSWSEWCLSSPHGDVTIYDDGVRPRNRKEHIAQWHVGARNEQSAWWIADHLRLPLKVT